MAKYLSDEEVFGAPSQGKYLSDDEVFGSERSADAKPQAKPRSTTEVVTDLGKSVAGSVKGRTWGEFGKDVALSAVQGVDMLAKLPAMAYDKATTGNWYGPETQKISAMSDERERLKSEESQAKSRQKAQIAKDAGEVARARVGEGALGTAAQVATEFGVSFWEAAKDPASIPEFVAQQAAQLGVMGKVGRGAEVAAQGLAKAAPRAAATRVGQTAIRNAGTAAAVGAGATLQGVDVGSDTMQRLMALPDALWQENPEYVALAREIGPQAAKERVASRLATDATLKAGAVSVATAALPGGSAIERALVGKGTGLKAVPRAFAGEAGQEGAEEGSGAYFGNKTVQQIDASQDAFEGVGTAAGQGAFMGGVMGGGISAGAAMARRYAGNGLNGEPDGQDQTQGAAPGAAPAAQAPAAQAPAAAGGNGVAPIGASVSDQRRAATTVPAAGVATANTDEAERALRAPVQLTALDRADELGAEISRIDARMAELAPENGYGPAFDGERAELQQAAEAARAEREQIAATWPTAIKGAPTSFSTEAGVKLDGEYALVDADDLVTSHDENLRANPLFPAELQPRDRSRSASELQVSGIVQKLDPARLGVSADAATGAPIVGADGLVESGNARTIALKRVYQANGQKAADYKAWLRQSAEQFGITPDAVDGLRKPVLVRVRNTPVNRAEFARQANQSTIQRMSPSEQAMADAKRLTSLEGLNPDENGDFTSSHDFIRQFMATLPITEQSDMIESDGRLSTTGYRRMQNAVLAKAYGESPTLRRMTESLDNNLVNISKALTRAAPVIAAARDRIAAGGLFDADISGDLVQAVEGLSAIKDKGWTVAQELGQTDLTGPKYSPEAAELLQFLADNVRSPRRIAEFLQRYYEALEAAGDPNQGSLLGDTAAPERAALMQQARGNDDGQQAARPAQEDRQQPQDAPGGGQSARADEGRTGQDAGAGQQGAEGGEAGQAGGLTDQAPLRADSNDSMPPAENSRTDMAQATNRDSEIGAPVAGPLASMPGSGTKEAPSSDNLNQAPSGKRTKSSEKSVTNEQPEGNESGKSMGETPVESVPDAAADTQALDALRREALQIARTGAFAKQGLTFEPAGGRLAVMFKGQEIARLDGARSRENIVKAIKAAIAAAAPDAAAPVLTSPTPDAVVAQQERAAQADALDAREQVKRESEVGAGQFELAREDGRQDTTGDIFAQAKAEPKSEQQAEPQATDATEKKPARARKPADKATAAEPVNQDVGEQLYANRRNFTGRGVRWDDVRELNDTLKLKEVTKAKVWPRPDYEKLVADGMPQVVARLVKQVYDGISAGPTMAGGKAPSDADLQRYIDTLGKVREGLFAFVNDGQRVAAFARGVLATVKRDAAAIGPVSVIDLARDAMDPQGVASVLLRQVWPEQFAAGAPTMSRFARGSDAQKEASIIGGNKALSAMQFMRDDLRKWVADLENGWPAKREAWQVQGYRVLGPGEYDSIGREQPDGSIRMLIGRPGKRGSWQANLSAEQLAESPFLLVQDGGFGAQAFKTREAAIDAAREKVKRQAGVGQDIRGTNIEDAERTGPARRQDGEDITSQRLMDTFGFRGVNFGREGWINQVERQAYLNQAFDGLMDLADVLGVPSRAMSLDGKLGIAFGAQGKGRNAAHFVPGYNEINLTRTKGAGTLAHEWGHALDHHFALQAGLEKDAEPFLSQHAHRGDKSNRMVFEDGRYVAKKDVPTFGDGIRPEIVRAFRDVYQAMNKRNETPEEADTRRQSNQALAARRLEQWTRAARRQIEDSTATNKAELLGQFDQHAEKMRQGDLGDGYEKSGNKAFSTRVAAVRSLIKDATGRLWSADETSGLEAAASFVRSLAGGREAGIAHEPQKVGTQYKRDSAAMDAEKGGKAYWSTPAEMFARAFELYVHDKLAQRGASNTFLTDAQQRAEKPAQVPDNSSAMARASGAKRDLYLYPVGQERDMLRGAFDDLVQAIETREAEDGNITLLSRRDSQTETPEFKRWFGDSVRTPARSASTFDEAREAARAFQGKDLINAKSGLVARVSRNSLDKMLSGKAVGKSESPASHSAAVANLDALFESATLGWSKPDSGSDANIQAIHRFFAPLNVQGRVLLAKLTIKEMADGVTPNRIYSVESVEFNEKSPAAQWVAASADSDGIDLTSTRSARDVQSLAQSIEDFNRLPPDIRMSAPTDGATDRLDFPKLQALAQRLKARMPNMPKVHVLEDPSKAPKALREYIIRQDAWYDVEGAMHDGELYLFASGLADEARAEHVLLEHEAAHYGLRAILGPSLKTAMRLVYIQNASVRRAVADLQKRGKLSDLVATEEVIVDIPTAELARLKGWRKVVDQVRAWLAERGYTALAERIGAWLQGTLSQQQRADLFVAELVGAARDYVAGKVPARAAVGMGTRLSGTLAEDIERQEKWLQREAQARGFKDIEDLLARDYPLFEKLAELWRKKNPAEVLLSRGKNGAMPETTAPGPQGDAQQGATQGNAVTAAAEQILQAMRMDSESDPYADYGLRVIPGDFTGEIAIGDELPPSNQWNDGEDTGEPLSGTSAIAIQKTTLDAIEKALRLTGADGSTRGPNGYYWGDRVVLIKGDRKGGGEDVGEILLKDATVVGMWKKSSKGASAIQPNDQSAPDTDGARLSRAAPPAGTAKPAAERAEAIIQKKAAGAAPLDRVAKLATRVTGVDRLTGAIYDKAGDLLARLTPEKVKAGLVSDYGVPEAVIDQRIMLQGRQRVQLRKVGNLIDKLSTLTREESRVAYEWMNMDGADPKAYLSAMQGLPEESVRVLQDVQKMIDDLSQEAVRLGQLDPESFKRNRFAYLRRSYAKHIIDQTTGEKAKRARVISILGDQYKGRGLVQAEPMAKMQAEAPDWWGRKLAAGKADTALKGQKFVRLEKRTLPGQASKAIAGMAPAGAGRVQAVTYWPADLAVPAKFADWTRADTWEVRDVKGGNVVLWRDFTKDEREKMGEIDEARFAIAKTLQGMVHDVEVGRYLEWLSKNYAKAEGQPIPGVVVEASERMRDTFAPGEWVKVPDTKIPGTGVLKYGKLAGKYLPGPVWNDLRQVVAGGHFKPFGETYATILRWWKTSKTALSPGVHMNNVMSSMVMADWQDVRAAHVGKALRIILAATGTKGGIADKEAALEILNRYKDSGGDIGTFATQEIARDQLDPLLADLETELAATGNSPAAQAGIYMALQHALGMRFPEAWEALKSGRSGKAVGKAGGKLIDLYQAEDDVFRLAAWLKAKEEGADDLGAGKVARRSFLDYNINAPWVQAMRASAWPFISFTYRAVPLLAEIAGKKPYKLMKLMLLAGGLNALGVLMGGGGEDDERKMLPEEKAGKIWGMVPKLIRMPWNDEHGSPVYLDIRRWVPVGDVFDVGAGNAAIPMFPGLMPGGPLVLAGEVVLNKSAFTGKAITLETDTGAEKAAKLGDYLYKAFAPNLLGLPNTYATEGVAGAATGRTDAFGRELSTPQALASAFGVKLGSYPADVLRRNLAAGVKAQESEIERNIAQLRRQYMTGRISREELDDSVAVQNEKLQKLGDKLREKIN